ncbi:MAG: hypothetical protein GF334_00465 [Candidatus Altiarchaeales archaeon]|nr:hypothetical protein [Candidatus Altiarchaeales archaeon]
MPMMIERPVKKVTPDELLQILLGAMRAMHWNYWTSHWQVSGSSFYGDHLMFSRMYEALVEEIDTLAEKMVGTFGPDSVENTSQMNWASSFLRSWSVYKCPYCRGLRSEKELQGLFKSFYEKLKEGNALSLGMDDYLMATASSHETNIYLLQQRMLKQEAIRKASLQRARKEAAEAAPSAEDYFFRDPEKKEVREFQESGQKGNLSKQEQRKGAPPTVADIKEEPGGEEFSTLNRYVIDTEEPTNLSPKRTPSPKLASWVFLED